MSAVDRTLDVGASVPLPVLPVAVAAAAATAFLLVPAPAAWVAVGLAVVGAAMPASLATWGAITVIGLAGLASPAAGWQAHLFLVMLHFMHTGGSLCLVLPRTGRLQLRALVGPARRWLLVQAAAQVVLTAVLAVAALPARAVLPGGLAALAVAVCAVVMVVLLRMLAARR